MNSVIQTIWFVTSSLALAFDTLQFQSQERMDALSRLTLALGTGPAHLKASVSRSRQQEQVMDHPVGAGDNLSCRTRSDFITTVDSW